MYMSISDSEYIDINIRKMPDGKWYSMEDMSPFNEDRFYSDNGGECAYVDIDRGDLDEIRSTDCKYTNAEGVLCYQANTTLPLCRSYQEEPEEIKAQSNDAFTASP